ncbi:RagB/SusD family nutrient uptake outer membrane protein [Pontibacter beigongshangensis]|uniref:RagB/SusD family nutrient uptake outer membrane protein n=1 Tax=Pontibacter beigongshangensis TaxID=2574733 RepID=UPI00164F0999|nr:RagB/SusD family nutrient uptake outer membrane protein [Pontibacter beigongshangensis]
MTRRTTYTFILSVIILFATSSCDKYLDLKPRDGVVRQEFWQTKEQVAAAINGCYASMLNPALAEKLFLWGELRADMLQLAAVPATYFNIVNVNIESTNNVTDWSAIYTTINDCNTVIEFAPGVLEVDKTFTQEALNAYIGEALALRSLMYFYLARSFGDVPLKLEATSTDKDEVRLPKSSQREVFEQIVKDLKTAEQYLPANYSTNDQTKGRITKFAVNAMLADVYLWLEDYNSSLAECDKVINAGRYGLVTGDNTWFTTIFYEGGSNESIFELYFHLNRQNPFYNLFAASNRRFRAALKVGEEIYTADEIDPTNKDIRGNGAALQFNDNSIWKYQGINSSSARASSASDANWIFYRYADILLMKAEALNQLGQGQAALDIVQVIRERANALPETEELLEPDDKLGIANYILAERAREFAFEGKRWYDLLRNARRNNYENLGLLLDIVPTTASLETQQSAIVKYRDYNSHYFPVYFYELETNKSLVQNPFYN